MHRLVLVLPLVFACDPNNGSDPDPDTDTAAPAMPCEDYFFEDPVQIDAYTWNGGSYYVATFPCCDAFEEVIDAATCTYVCAAGGGITGWGDGSCPDFYEDATHDGTVWTAE